MSLHLHSHQEEVGNIEDVHDVGLLSKPNDAPDCEEHIKKFSDIIDPLWVVHLYRPERDKNGWVEYHESQEEGPFGNACSLLPLKAFRKIMALEFVFQLDHLKDKVVDHCED